MSGNHRHWGTGARARLGALLALCACALTALLAMSAPAFALSERGHVFTSSFGSAGEGSGQFARPAGVAVNESTGDVYVVDRANSRVERFDSSGNFISAWGYDVGQATKEKKVLRLKSARLHASRASAVGLSRKASSTSRKGSPSTTRRAVRRRATCTWS